MRKPDGAAAQQRIKDFLSALSLPKDLKTLVIQGAENLRADEAIDMEKRLSEAVALARDGGRRKKGAKRPHSAPPPQRMEALQVAGEGLRGIPLTADTKSEASAPAVMRGIQRATLEGAESAGVSAMELSNEHIPPELRVPPGLKEALRPQTALVRKWAEVANDLNVQEARFHRKNFRVLDRFQTYLKAVKDDLRLFVEESKFPVTRSDVMEMQKKIAYNIHGLSYFKDSSKPRSPGRWMTNRLAPQAFEGRSGGFLDHFMDNVPEALKPKTIAKVDLAMIAHCFRLPVELWLIYDLERFKFWAGEASEGRDLLSFSGLATIDNSFACEDLGSALPPNQIQTPMPKAVIAEFSPPDKPTGFPAHTYLRFKFDLPEGFETAQVMFFEDDGKDVCLLSTKKASDGNLLYSGGSFETPRRRRVLSPGASEEEKSEDRVGAFHFHPCARTTFVALIVAANSNLRLDSLDFYSKPTKANVPILDLDQIVDLRSRLFELPPTEWLMLKKEVAIV